MDDRPSLEQWAKKGKEDREVHAHVEVNKQKKKEQEAVLYRRREDQNRVATHISASARYSIVYGLHYHYVLISLFLFGAIASFFVSGFFLQAFTGGQVAKGAFFCPPIALGLLYVLYRWNRKCIRRDLKQEKKWIEKAPFAMVAYPDLFVYRSYPSATFSLRFKNESPDPEMVLNILNTLGFKVTSQAKEDDPFRFEVKNPKGSKFHSQRRWLYLWVHAMVDGPLMALHQKYPLASLVFGDGKKELNFSWWDF